MAQINTRIVLRNDTKANWETVKDTVTLMVGEIGIETDTGLFKIGKEKSPGVLCTWAELEYANEIPEVDFSTVTNSVKVESTLEALGTGAVVGDMGIVKAPLYQGATEYTYTAYVWNGTNWAAMDGNYSAANVFIPEDITLSGDFGTVYDTADKKYYSITTLGNKKIGDTFAAGTSMQEMWSEILSKRLQPSKTDPSISISASGDDGNKEVGDTYTKPTATLTVNSGNYTYGYKDASGTKQTGTGVTFPTAKIAYGADDTITTANQYVTAEDLANGGTVSIAATKYAADATTASYTDNTVNYTFSGNASNTAGEIAIDNLGAPSDPVVQIAANNKITATDKTVGFRGYRKMFCGYNSAAALNSGTIRALSYKLTSDGKTYNGSKAGTTQIGITLPEGATNLVIACPTKSVGKKYTLSKVEMYSAGVWDDYTSKFEQQNTAEAPIAVDGKVEGKDAQNYNVYMYKFAALKGDTQFRFTLAAVNA